MIENALILLREELSSYLVAHADPATVIVDNVSKLGSENADVLNESIIISLVNLEQESAFKNGSLYQKTEHTAIYQNVPIHLNLYILISSNFNLGAPPNNGYLLALKRLTMVVRFFQGKSIFSPATSAITLPPPLNNLSNPEISSLKVTLELFTLSFEQINHLWGSLGGRQLPSVLYKARMVTITENKDLREVPLIEAVDVKPIEFPIQNGIKKFI